MKKTIFYLSIIIELYLLVLIAIILFKHLNELTQYGYGFLVGKIILLLLFGFTIYKTNPYKKKKTTNFN